MSTPTGLGYMTWLLAKMPTPADLLALCRHYDISWWTIKLLDGPAKYNRLGGDDKIAIDYVRTLSEGGVRVGMWQYCYGRNPGPEGSAVGTTFEKFERYGLSFHMVDAEGGEWNKWGSKKRAETYMNSLNLPLRVPVYLNSYRFPSYFPRFPFASFMRHSRMTGTMPQVYWEFAHNPVEQLVRSLMEYREITDKPFIPIFPTYLRGAYLDPNGWNPTPEDLRNFIAQCDGLELESYGGYSLDKVLQHYDNIGVDWMRAVTGEGPIPDPTPPPPPPPPPSPPPGNDVRLAEVVAYRSLWMHSDPDVSTTSRSGHKITGRYVYVYGDTVQDAAGRVWANVGPPERPDWMCMDDRGTQLLRWVT